MAPLNRVRHLAPAILMAAFVVSIGACGGDYPNSTFSHHTEFNTAIGALWDRLLFWGTLVFVVVESLLIYTIVRFRKREGAPLPKPVHGNTKLEITWTVIPILILVVIAIPTVRTIFKTQAPASSAALQIEVTGHQWWWEFKYPQYGFSTANEFYIPTGRTVNFTLRSADVVHSFWIPQLGGKRDLISTRTNYLWYTPSADLKDMVSNGFCAEYCGLSHANMRIRAYTVAPAEFESWAQGQKAPAVFTAPAPPALASIAGTGAAKAPAAAPGWVFPAENLPDYAKPNMPVPADIAYDDALLAQGDAARGLQLVVSGTAACKNCHAINGVPGAVVPLAPNLTHLASRHTIGAGLFPNDAPHLARWIKNAPKMKPGAQMNAWGTGELDALTKKTVTYGALTDQQIADLVAYFRALK